MRHKNGMSPEEWGRVAEALELVPMALAQNALSPTWAKIRDAGLLLRDRIGDRAPTVGESRLITTAEKIARWNPPPRPPPPTPYDDRVAEAEAELARRDEAYVDALRELERLEPGAFHMGEPGSVEITDARDRVRDTNVALVRASAAKHEVERVRMNWLTLEWCAGRIGRESQVGYVELEK